MEHPAKRQRMSKHEEELSERCLKFREPLLVRERRGARLMDRRHHDLHRRQVSSVPATDVTLLLSSTVLVSIDADSNGVPTSSSTSTLVSVLPSSTVSSNSATSSAAESPSPSPAASPPTEATPSASQPVVISSQSSVSVTEIGSSTLATPPAVTLSTSASFENTTYTATTSARGSSSDIGTSAGFIGSSPGLSTTAFFPIASTSSSVALASSLASNNGTVTANVYSSSTISNADPSSSSAASTRLNITSSGSTSSGSISTISTPTDSTATATRSSSLTVLTISTTHTSRSSSSTTDTSSIFSSTSSSTSSSTTRSSSSDDSLSSSYISSVQFPSSTDQATAVYIPAAATGDPTSSAAVAGSTDGGQIGKEVEGDAPETTTVVGGVVGSVAGVAIVILLVMLLLRWYRRRSSRAALQLPENDSSTSFQPNMQSRSGRTLFNAVPAVLLSRLRGHSRSPARQPQPQSGFERVSGRKMPSAFSPGMTSEQVAQRDFVQPAQEREGRTFYRGSDSTGPDYFPAAGVVNLTTPTPGESPPERQPPYSDAIPAEKETLMPSPARTPTIKHAKPYASVDLAASNTALMTTNGREHSPPPSSAGPPSTPAHSVRRSDSRATMGRSLSIYDGSRGSRFTEDVV